MKVVFKRYKKCSKGAYLPILKRFQAIIKKLTKITLAVLVVIINEIFYLSPNLFQFDFQML